MKRLRNIHLSAVLVFALIFMIPACSSQTAKTETQTLTIVHTNDVHAHVDIEPYVKGYVDSLKEMGENVLLLSAGDAFAGTTFASLSQAQDVVTVMNMTGYDSMVLGNHEQLMKEGTLATAVASCDFPVLAINVPDAFSKAAPGLKSYEIFEFHGNKIAVIGINAYGCLDSYGGGFVTGDEMVAATEAAKAGAEADGATIFIGLSHLGLNDPDETLRGTYIADNCPWFDLLIEGHCHTALEEGLVRNGVLIAETGEYGNNIGVIELKFERGSIVEKTARLISVKDNEEQCGIIPDADVTAFIAERTASNEAYLNEVLGQIPEDMTSDRTIIRKEEAALGNLITDAFRWKTSADFATYNSSGIRTDLTKGDFTREQLLNLFLTQNSVITVEVDGNFIFQWMENSVSALPEQNAYFKQISGLIVEFDSSREPGDRIVSISLSDGTPIDPNGTYLHATDGEPDFYPDTIGKADPVEGVDFRGGYGTFQEIFVDYINSGDMTDPHVSGRIKDIQSQAVPSIA